MKENIFSKKLNKEITEIENTIKLLQERKEVLAYNPSLYIDRELEDLKDEKEGLEDDCLDTMNNLEESLSDIDFSLVNLSNSIIKIEKINKKIVEFKKYKGEIK